MKSFANVLVFSLAIGFVCGALWYRGNAVHPDYPGQCYYEELKQAIPVSQSLTPLNQKGHCNRISCRSDFVLEIEFCSRHNLLPNATCNIESDIKEPYPACCPKLVCENELVTGNDPFLY